MSRLILGIANLDVRSHDNAACLVDDGKLVAQCEEERLIRRKHAYDTLPTEAIRFCLKRAGAEVGDIDTVTVGWDLKNTSFYNTGEPAVTDSNSNVLRKLFPDYDGDIAANLVYVPHHLSHAAVTYYASGFRDAAGLVVDGAGESDATSYWGIRNGKFDPLLALGQNPHSLGFMYEAACEYLGFNGADAGKVMGLASYHSGKAKHFENVDFENGYAVNFPDDVRASVDKEFGTNRFLVMDYIVALWKRYLEVLFGDGERFRGNDSAKVFREKAKIAARLQSTLEAALGSAARYVKDRTGADQLCMAGGVALNCSANGSLEKGGLFKEIYVYPAPGDSGVALGSALYVHGNENGLNAIDRSLLCDNPYWGPEFSDDQIEEILSCEGIVFERCRPDFSDVAKYIADGQIVAWFQGPMEIGPRALGGRSILADPRNAEMHDRVNAVKGRENWRPLAPSVLAGHEADYFDPAIFSPFMLKAAYVRDDKRAVIPAVVHVDGTSRYQSVLRETNPRYWALIDSFRQKTGIPIVMNTSLNHQEPIVCTPRDALKTFYARAIDRLAIGSFIVSK